VLSQLKDYEKAAARGIEKQLSASVNELIHKANLKTKEPALMAFALMGAMTLAVFAVGFLSGQQWGDGQRSLLRAKGQLTQPELKADGSLIFRKGHEIANGRMGVSAFGQYLNES
jgi:hypothetical protein